MKKILWLVPILVIVWLLNKNLVPSGTLEAVYDFTKPSPYISELRPGGRLTPIQNGTQTIIDDPVFFSVRPPSQFDSAEVEVVYQNHGAPIIELGAQVGSEDWQLDLRPVEVLALESSSWHRLQDGPHLLLTKDARVKGSYGLRSMLKPSDQFATYRYEIFHDPPQMRVTSQNTNLGIRGRHTVYFGAVPTRRAFTIHEVNRNPGYDKITMQVLDEPRLWGREWWSDDGIADASGASSTERTITLETFSIPRAPFRLDIDASDDVVFDTLLGYRGPLVFGKRLYLADAAAHGADEMRIVYVQGSYLRARTAHESGRQTLKVGNASLDIPVTNQWVRTKLPGGLVPVAVPTHDVLLETDGFFSLAREQFFEPTYPALTPETDVGKLDAILARYDPPTRAGDWKIARAKFDLQRLFLRPDGYRFVLSLPEIKQVRGGVVMKQIRVVFRRPPESLWARLLRFARKDRHL